MRFIILHKTEARWEAGETPSPAFIARVEALLGELGSSGRLLAGEGLTASSQGVRLRFTGGVAEVIEGPFDGGNELPAGFSILRAQSIEEAIEWASREAAVLGDVEIDIRPVSEAWDIGIGEKPADVTTRRYMVLRKATNATEAGTAPSPAQRTRLARLIEEATRTGAHLVTETMRPSARGRRYKNSRNGVSMFDGPFIESKELIAGYIIVSADTLTEVDPWARKYMDTVEAGEVDVRELE